MDKLAALDLFGNSNRSLRFAAGFQTTQLFSVTDTGGQLPPEDIPWRRLFELSVNAHDALVDAWMSELPITAEMIRFCRKALAAAEQAGQNLCGGQRQEAERRAADTALTDRDDSDVRAVLEAAYKVRREIDRLRGLLRFNPNADGVYIACCEPDHFVLPALGEHFERRFGGVHWAITDEKRRLCLCVLAESPPQLYPLEQAPFQNPRFFPASGDSWETLWKHYHRTINNESRNNPRLQRQFIPQRYWKYLPEM